MAQILTTDLPALATRPSGVLSLLLDDRKCVACGGDVISNGDENPGIAVCGTCYAVDLAPIQATLAALVWAKAAGHEIDEINISEWTHEDYDPPPVPIPGRYWLVDLDTVEGVCAARCPVFVIQHADGSMQVVPDDFPTCHYQDVPDCGKYILTDATGTRRCPEHGEVTAWNIPVSFYADGPDLLAEDTAAFAKHGTVQWFDDYPDDDSDE